MTNKPPQFTLDKFSEAIVFLLARIDALESLINQTPTTPTTSKILNAKELCDYLDITMPTLIKYKKKGKIPFIQIGNAPRYELEKVIAAMGKKPK